MVEDRDGEAAVVPEREVKRIITFIVLQVLFLAISPLTSGLHYKMWSMLDSAILVLSIGLTA